MAEDRDLFNLLVGDDSPVSKRLKNLRVKGENDRYAIPDKDWDPFESLPGRQEPSEEIF